MDISITPPQRAPFTADVGRASRLEWLDVDGRGGYASGTIAGVSTRRYHGLLLVARHPPHQRAMLVNHLSERLAGPTGVVALSTDTLEAAEESGRRLTSFTAHPIPTWTYDVDGATIERRVFRVYGRDVVVVRWRLVGGPSALQLVVRPLLTARGDHDVARESAGVDETASSAAPREVSWQPHADFPRIHARCTGTYRHDPAWTRDVGYAIDAERGEPSREDWWSPGAFTLDLAPGQSAWIAFGADSAPDDGETAFAAESKRRAAIEASATPTSSPLFDGLRYAATSYLVACEGGAAVLAGFPWFDVWTRDTFTAFAGLYLVTGRHDDARRILTTFAPLVARGTLPANLPDAVTKPRWNAADAPLWFVVSVGRYRQFTGDRDAVAGAIWTAVRTILDGYAAGRAPHVRIDDDGLVHASAPDQALTWMDADDQGKIMTPRRGKPVEIQALWIRALDVARCLAEEFGDAAYARRCAASRARAVASFQARFWHEESGHLFDVVDGPDGDDARLRPNQLFALSLNDDLVPRARALRVLDVVRRRLLTPVGLRTLPADDPDYHARYVGDQARRDPAYHQGTVWPFLLGPFVTAWIRAHDGTPEARATGLGFLTGIEERLTGEGCLGHLSEIYDADAPHAPRGCFAQAWSVGEVLMALHEAMADGGSVA